MPNETDATGEKASGGCVHQLLASQIRVARTFLPLVLLSLMLFPVNYFTTP